jgi:hypothetical protein
VDPAADLPSAGGAMDRFRRVVVHTAYGAAVGLQPFPRSSARLLLPIQGGAPRDSRATAVQRSRDRRRAPQP